MRLSLTRIQNAYKNLPPEFRDSPQYGCQQLSDALGCKVTLKVETQNPIRCFKGRGTHLAISESLKNQPTAIVCASAGNLGQAVAYCAKSAGVDSVVFAAYSANKLKLKQIEALGSSLRLVGGDIEVARLEAREHARLTNAVLVEDSENISTCEGAGTIGLELTDSASPAFDAVLVSLGAGALASGVGHVFKSLSPKTQVISVQPHGAPAMTLSWREQRVVQTESTDTIADGVAGRFPIDEVLQDLLQVIDDVVLVKDESIIRGMRMIYQHAGLVVEPSAALGVAAILEQPQRFRLMNVALILCGSNVDPLDFKRWVIDPLLDCD